MMQRKLFDIVIEKDPALRKTYLSEYLVANSVTDSKSSHPNTQYNCAVTIALEEGHLDSVELLLDAKADINALNGSGNTMLAWAAKNNRVDYIKTLLELKADIQGGQGSDPLTSAVKKGNTASVKELIAQKADIHRQTMGDTPLLHAIRGGYSGCAELLIQAKADINKEGNGHNTALILATLKNDEKSINLLLESKADVNYVPLYGEPVLTRKIMQTQKPTSQDMAIFNKLLSAKADVNVLGYFGDTPLLKDTEGFFLKPLLFAKANPNLANKQGMTPLMLHAQKFKLERVRELIEGGSDVNLRDKNNKNSFDYAVEADIGHTLSYGVTYTLWKSDAITREYEFMKFLFNHREFITNCSMYYATIGLGIVEDEKVQTSFEEAYPKYLEKKELIKAYLSTELKTNLDLGTGRCFPIPLLKLVYEYDGSLYDSRVFTYTLKEIESIWKTGKYSPASPIKLEFDPSFQLEESQMGSASAHRNRLFSRVYDHAKTFVNRHTSDKCLVM